MRLVYAECNDGDAQDGLFKIILPYSVDIWPAHVPKGALAREVVSTRAHQYLTVKLSSLKPTPEWSIMMHTQ